MEKKTKELAKKLAEITKQEVTISETISYKSKFVERFKLNVYDRKKTFKENLQQNNQYFSEENLQTELDCRIFAYKAE